MKIKFKNRLEAISWIVGKADNEGQFEVMREQLNYNYIYHGTYFIDTSNSIQEVIIIDNNK